MISRIMKLLCIMMLIQSSAVVDLQAHSFYSPEDVNYENPKRKGGKHDMFPFWINYKGSSHKRATLAKLIILKTTCQKMAK